METENAKIRSTMLGADDRSSVLISLELEYDGAYQAFGAYSGTRYDEQKDVHVGTDWGMEFVHRVLQTLGVTTWEKLPGTYLRARHDHGKIYAIGHIIKDQWFDPKELDYLLEEPCAKS